MFVVEGLAELVVKENGEDFGGSLGFGVVVAPEVFPKENVLGGSAVLVDAAGPEELEAPPPNVLLNPNGEAEVVEVVFGALENADVEEDA